MTRWLLGGCREALLVGLLSALPALADESTVKLKDGEGRQVVEKNCVACHSLDYIAMNSVFMDRKGWDASVMKMIKAMGAPVANEEVPIIVEYLTRNYGKP